jgi:hypothetical protein
MTTSYCFLGGKVERAFVVVSFVTLNSSIDWITVELLTALDTPA